MFWEPETPVIILHICEKMTRTRISIDNGTYSSARIDKDAYSKVFEASIDKDTYFNARCSKNHQHDVLKCIQNFCEFKVGLASCPWLVPWSQRRQNGGTSPCVQKLTESLCMPSGLKSPLKEAGKKSIGSSGLSALFLIVKFSVASLLAVFD